ncbi:MAG: sensor histidine kinase [Armatimonadota bacterium]
MYRRRVDCLKEADRAKDEFLAVLSHELKTPLTNLLGWSKLALDKQTPEFTMRAMEVIQRNALRQKRLVEEILDLSRLVHRIIELESECTDLWTQASQSVESARQVAVERKLHLVLDPPSVPLPIYADPIRLQQCIGNLLHNSLKFTPAGGTITVSCRRDGDQAVLAVRDTGCGIDEAALPALFAAFRQVDRNERHGGLGLGLAIARGLVELHGGQIAAYSSGKNQGATFIISLPLTPDNSRG